MSPTRHHTYTLVEILVVLGVIGLLAALAFPAFNAVRRRSYGTVCVSNLKQLGLAVNLYTQDYDGMFPRGGDPTDLNTDIWQDAANGIYQWQVDQLPPLTYVLIPYIKAPAIWRCPADTGFVIDDISNTILNAHPSMFQAYGMSYSYRTELTLKNKKDLLGWDSSKAEHGPADINILADGSGSWHGQDKPKSLRRYNVLMGDSHVANLTWQQFKTAWALKLEPPA